MKQHAFVISLVLLAFVPACNGRGSARVRDLLGGDAAYPLIADGAQTVTAYRIDGMDRKGKTNGVHGYPMLAGPVDVDKTSQRELADVLTSDGTYLWDIAKACEFSPGVAIRYEDGGESVDVLLCFSCDELEVYAGAEKVGHEDFDPRRADLVKVAKRLFPNDKQIQGLK
ncbi:MAG: hypothetical protein V3T86_03705 [Planctomycetota bacterium]